MDINTELIKPGRLLQVIGNSLNCSGCFDPTCHSVALCQSGHILCKTNCYPYDTGCCHKCNGVILMSTYETPKEFRELKDTYKIDSILEKLTCRICKKLFEGKVTLYTEIQRICGNCRSEESNCLLNIKMNVEAKYLTLRNIWLEKIIKNLQPKKLNKQIKEKVYTSLKWTSFKLNIVCPFQNACDKKLKMGGIFNHLQECHSRNYFCFHAHAISTKWNYIPLTELESSIYALKIQKWGLFILNLEMLWNDENEGKIKLTVQTLINDGRKYKFKSLLSTIKNCFTFEDQCSSYMEEIGEYSNTAAVFQDISRGCRCQLLIQIHPLNPSVAEKAEN